MPLVPYVCLFYREKSIREERQQCSTHLLTLAFASDSLTPIIGKCVRGNARYEAFSTLTRPENGPPVDR